MQRSSARRRIGNRAPLAAIELAHPGQTDERGRAGVLLMVFMRIVALLCLGEGLLQWSSVLLDTADGQSGLVILSTPAIVSVVFFAIIDLIAGVGLWLAAPWGGVIWLVTAGAQLVVIISLPGFYRYPAATGAVDVALVVAYLVLTWQVARSHEARLKLP